MEPTDFTGADFKKQIEDFPKEMRDLHAKVIRERGKEMNTFIKALLKSKKKGGVKQTIEAFANIHRTAEKEIEAENSLDSFNPVLFMFWIIEYANFSKNMARFFCRYLSLHFGQGFVEGGYTGHVPQWYFRVDQITPLQICELRLRHAYAWSMARLYATEFFLVDYLLDEVFAKKMTWEECGANIRVGFTDISKRSMVEFQKRVLLILDDKEGAINSLAGYAYTKISLTHNQRLATALRLEWGHATEGLLSELPASVAPFLDDLDVNTILDFPAKVVKDIEKTIGRLNVDNLDNISGGVPSSSSDFTQDIIDRQHTTTLIKSAELSSQEKRVLDLTLAGLSEREISQRTQKQIGTVRSLKSRAKIKIQAATKKVEKSF